MLRLKLPEGSNIYAYADDLAVVVMADCVQDHMSKADNALDNVTFWLGENDLEIAPEKTEAVVFPRGHKRKLGIKFTIDCGNKAAESSKILGYMGG